MTTRPFRLGPWTVTIQRDHTIRKIRSLEDAQRVIESAIDRYGPGIVRELLRETSGPLLDDDESAERLLIERLLDGTLVAVIHETQRRTLDPPQSTRLVDLLVDEPDAGHPLSPPIPDRGDETTSLSFRVVDEHGSGAQGEYRIMLDGRAESGALEARRHAYGELREAVDARVSIDELGWDTEAQAGTDDPGGLPNREIRVHIDTLEYTRAGLRFRADVSLEAGVHTQIVVRRPPAVRAVAASHAGFPVDQSFPLPAVLSLMLFQHQGNLDSLFTGPSPRQGVYQIFAHADASGGIDHNKALTDQRAAVMAAMLTGDVDALISVARSESWGLDLQQVMLRALECDPGPIDGIAGSLTAHAVEQFQERYGEGEYHRSPAAG